MWWELSPDKTCGKNNLLIRHIMVKLICWQDMWEELSADKICGKKYLDATHMKKLALDKICDKKDLW